MSLQPPRRAPEEERRLIVLYSLHHLAPCNHIQLYQFIAELEQMDYFDMMFVLNDLCDQGQAVRLKRRVGYQYEVTDAGREVLQLFGNRVPHSLKMLLAETGASWHARFQEEAQFHHEIIKTEQGETELILSVVENDSDSLRITIPLPSEDLAHVLAARWRRKGGDIYGTIFRLLMEDSQ
jgi:DNA-binding PadR family transcriptional regulator